MAEGNSVGNTPSQAHVPSMISADLNITGDVISKSEIQVDGQIKGDIHCASLVVGETAVISGSIVADEVTVRGKVIGSIRGLRVSLQSASHVTGDIFHKTLAIEMGAFFEGKSRRSGNPLSASARPEDALSSKVTPPQGQPQAQQPQAQPQSQNGSGGRFLRSL